MVLGFEIARALDLFAPWMAASSFTNTHLNFDKQSLNKPNDKKIIPPLDLFNIGL